MVRFLAAARLCRRSRQSPATLDGLPTTDATPLSHPVGLRKRLKSSGRSSSNRSDTARTITNGTRARCASAAKAALSISRPMAWVARANRRFSDALPTMRSVDTNRPTWLDCQTASTSSMTVSRSSPGTSITGDAFTSCPPASTTSRPTSSAPISAATSAQANPVDTARPNG